MKQEKSFQPYTISKDSVLEGLSIFLQNMV